MKKIRKKNGENVRVFHRVSTKLIITYSVIVIISFQFIYWLSVYILNKQTKEELIRTDTEALNQISNSIVLMTDIMVEKIISVYSEPDVQWFFTEGMKISQKDLPGWKSSDYQTAQRLRRVKQVLQENALLYTQMDGGITLVTGNGGIYTSWGSDNSVDYSQRLGEDKENWDSFFNEDISAYKWEMMEGREAINFEKSAEDNLLMCIYCNRVLLTKEIRGYICASIDAGELERCYGSYLDSEINNQIYILDSEKRVMVGLNEENSQISQTIQAVIQENMGSQQHFVYQDENDLYNCVSIEERNWVLVNKIPLSYIGNNEEYFKLLFFWIFLVGGAGACLLVIFFTFRFSERIKNMKALMISASKDGYNRKYQLKYYDELDEIGQSFNDMIDEIKRYTKRLVQEEKEKKLNEINYLHAQINTHFLYNIFNSIKMLSILGRNKDINEVITALVKLLRGTLDVSDEMLTIEEELKNVEYYFRIENIIHLEELQLKIHCEESLGGKMIPKLLIQPVVENSFLHGFSHTVSSSKKIIEITVEQEGRDAVYVKVKDNGCGISKQQLMNIRNYRHGHTRSIGLRNIEERIQLLFGEGYGIRVESVVNVGTEVIMKIPVIESDEWEKE